MLNPPPSLSNVLYRKGKWLLIVIVIAVLAMLFARKITQLSLPGLGVPAKTVIIEPRCPTPEQKDVIEKNLKLYGAGFSMAYDNTKYANRLIAMAKTLGYPEGAGLEEINSVLRFLREALKKKC